MESDPDFARIKEVQLGPWAESVAEDVFVLDRLNPRFISFDAPFAKGFAYSAWTRDAGFKIQYALTSEILNLCKKRNFPSPVVPKGWKSDKNLRDHGISNQFRVAGNIIFQALCDDSVKLLSLPDARLESYERPVNGNFAFFKTSEKGSFKSKMSAADFTFVNHVRKTRTVMELKTSFSGSTTAGIPKSYYDQLSREFMDVALTSNDGFKTEALLVYLLLPEISGTVKPVLRMCKFDPASAVMLSMYSSSLKILTTPEFAIFSNTSDGAQRQQQLAFAKYVIHAAHKTKSAVTDRLDRFAGVLLRGPGQLYKRFISVLPSGTILNWGPFASKELRQLKTVHITTAGAGVGQRFFCYISR